VPDVALPDVAVPPFVVRDRTRCGIHTMRVVALALLTGCASLRPVEPTTRLDGRVAKNVVLALPAPCELVPGSAPMGRPNGVPVHTLPPGSYTPSFEDDEGVYFASPSGVVVAEATLAGARARPGGIFLPTNPKAALVAFEYLGDAQNVSGRLRLPEHCRYSLQPAAPPEQAPEQNTK
jgi:hypothetical protein